MSNKKKTFTPDPDRAFTTGPWFAARAGGVTPRRLDDETPTADEPAADRPGKNTNEDKERSS